ncbi:hypothetical protein ACLBYG_21040 [Methylobacterium sp. D53M]
MNAHPLHTLPERLLAARRTDAAAGPEPVGAYERNHADGELGASLFGLDGLIESLSAMAWSIERATGRGAGQAYDLDKLRRLSERLGEAHQKVEIAAGRLTAKLARAR